MVGLIETESRLAVAVARGRGKREMVVEGYKLPVTRQPHSRDLMW